MKFSELKPCDACGKGLGLFFYRVQIEQHGVNVAEMRKRHAMDVMFPGAPGLAATFHGDSDDGTIKIQTRTRLLCRHALSTCRRSPSRSRATTKRTAKGVARDLFS